MKPIETRVFQALRFDAKCGARVPFVAISAAFFLLGAIPTFVEAATPIDFNKQIRPILSNRCFKCHGPDSGTREGGLRLDTHEGAIEELASGVKAIVPGDAEHGELLARVTSTDEDVRMPPVSLGAGLTAVEVDLLKEWIRQGAPYAKHWSYIKPERPAVPTLENDNWSKNDIDRFILARLQREKLTPAPEADRTTLARRVALDLTGIPPTTEELKAFLADKDPMAYENYVDRMLAKPAYGEHWAHMWLDLARYADSCGYVDDKPRTIWAFRDWVIRAINADMPFDQFTIEQIAGDMLPNPTNDQLIATAFHRNTQTNNEGGTIDEEFRNAAIVDRVNTTMSVWMGVTMGCCQCHHHKFDPISQEDYFRFFAVLNTTEDADRGDDSPLLPVFAPENISQRTVWQAELDAMPKPPAKDAPPPDEETKKIEARRAELTKLIAGVKPELTMPIMREQAAGKGRVTKLQIRGNYLNHGDEMKPGLPESFPQLPADQKVDRLAMAKWLVSPENPLTARVIANRYWEAIFGVGIVRTSEDFGSQGEQPTNPELLDWIATELQRNGWNTKALVRMFVTSAAYRQSSKVTMAEYERDPDNNMLARGPRFRLSAEMVRDQALAVSGLLSKKMYGAPVNPPQPSFGLTAAFGGGMDWKTSAGEDKFRRALYTTWRRTNPYPSMATFDAPNRDVCTVRRTRTNTPLQALVTLNDPVYVEAAQSLARKIAAQPGDDAAKVRYAILECTGREASDIEVTQIVNFKAEALKRFVVEPAKANEMATNPIGPLPAGANAAELAAWSVVGNVLLNLDEMFMKR